MNKPSKKRIEVFGDTYYLIGIDRNGQNVYMQDFSWDCGWYWGGGYLTTFTNNKQPTRSRGISSHYHFEGLADGCDLYDGMKNHFEMTTLSDKEKWELCDLMGYFYTLRKSAEQVARGGSNYTSVEGMTKHQALGEKLNSIIEDEVIPQVIALLSPVGK